MVEHCAQEMLCMLGLGTFAGGACCFMLSISVGSLRPFAQSFIGAQLCQHLLKSMHAHSVSLLKPAVNALPHA
jgi:hypothetical protein